MRGSLREQKVFEVSVGVRFTLQSHEQTGGGEISLENKIDDDSQNRWSDTVAVKC